jgi:hypothetical protein
MTLFHLIFLSSIILGLIGTFLFAMTVLSSSLDSLKYLATSPYGGWNERLYYDLVRQRGQYVVGIVVMVFSFSIQSYIILLSKIKADYFCSKIVSLLWVVIFISFSVLIPFLMLFIINKIQKKKATKISAEWLKPK